MTDYIEPPWTEEQVELLNELQKSGRIHPYTCSGGGGTCSHTDLVATRDGWKCPGCGRIQGWAAKDNIELAKLIRQVKNVKKRG